MELRTELMSEEKKMGEIQTLINRAFELSQQLEERAKQLSTKLMPISSAAEVKDTNEDTPYVTDVGRILGNIIENMSNTYDIVNGSHNRLQI